MKRPLIIAVMTLCALVGLAVAVRHDLAGWFQQTGRARWEAGDYAGAEAAFRRALGLGDDAAARAYDLGVSLYRKGDLAQAQQQFAAATVTTAPGLVAAARYNRGNSLYRQGEQLAARDRAGRRRDVSRGHRRLSRGAGPVSRRRRCGGQPEPCRGTAGRTGARWARDQRPPPAGTEKPIIPSGADGNGVRDAKGQASARQATTPQSAVAGQAPGADSAEDPAITSGKARPDLTPGEVERLLNEARGRERPAGNLHDGKPNQPLARPEKDW